MIGVEEDAPYARLRIGQPPSGAVAGSIEAVQVSLTLGETIEATKDAAALDAFVAEQLPKLGSSFYSFETPTSVVADMAERLARAVLPGRIESALRLWHSGRDGSSVVIVEADEPYADLPWELLPSHFGDGLFVVRSTTPSGRPTIDARIPTPATVLAAGWDRVATGDRLPGIDAELKNLARGFSNDDLRFVTLPNPEIGDFEQAMVECEPSIVHLSIANGFSHDPDVGPRTRLSLFPSVPLSKEARPDDEAYLDDDRLMATLSQLPSLRLVFFNTMPNPVVPQLPLYRRLCTELGVAVVGWGGTIQDSVAVDYASYWYRRALEGATVVEATQVFAAQFSLQQWVAGATPVIWVPHEDWLQQAALSRDRTRQFDKIMVEQRADLTSFGAPNEIDLDLGVLPSAPEFEPAPPTSPGPVPESLGGGAPEAPPPPAPPPPKVEARPMVTIGLELQDGLFPALLTNGFKPIVSLTVEANQEFNARLEIECDAGIGRSVYRVARRLLVDRNTVPIQDAEFPVLYELTSTSERRTVTFTVTVLDARGTVVGQSTSAVRWYGSRDWLNEKSTARFIAAYVLPMTRGVSDLVNEAQQILRQIDGPVSGFEGYPAGASPEDTRARVSVQMRAIFQAVRQLDIRYIAPPGLPVYVFDPTRMSPDDELAAGESTEADEAAVRRTGQIVRLPEDVLERRHGTCHDLSLLFAAALEYVGLHPLVVLLPGHTFFAVWASRDAHEKYWNESGGVGWEIPSETFKALVDSDAIIVVEPNLSAHPLGTFDRAAVVARQYLPDRTHVVDISRSRSRVQPLRMT